MDDFLTNGTFDRHLRRMRGIMRNRVVDMARMITNSFPPGTKISSPQGGYVLWVQMGEGVDGFELSRRAKEAGVSILPGEICSSTGAYKNCIRLSCWHPWSVELEEGITKLANIVAELQDG
ncbi:MAG: hypothetical protein OEV73_08440 [Desulfobulbaceae bacterium]|nr:hypothetical protein [Desulfobulbaceae bacterium]